VERTVATRTDMIAVSGRIDRLDARPELVVVDYKTGRHLLTTDDARSSMALALYALAAGRALRRPCHQVELHHLPTGEVLAWSHTEESLARHLGRAEGIAEECAAADERMRDGLPADAYDEVFPPRPGPSCGWCDYRATAPKAPRPPPPAAPGTASPPADRSGGTADGGRIRARGLGRVPELGQRAGRGGGRLDGGGVHGRRDAAGGREPAGHVLLRGRGPGVVVSP
jgi:ATP-dependent nuclease, subunit B